MFSAEKEEEKPNCVIAKADMVWLVGWKYVKLPLLLLLMRMAVKLLMIEAISKKNERKREYRRGKNSWVRWDWEWTPALGLTGTDWFQLVLSSSSVDSFCCCQLPHLSSVRSRSIQLKLNVNGVKNCTVVTGGHHHHFFSFSPPFCPFFLLSPPV